MVRTLVLTLETTNTAGIPTIEVAEMRAYCCPSPLYKLAGEIPMYDDRIVGRIES